MNDATRNWLFAPDIASAAQARTILENEQPAPGLLLRIVKDFGGTTAANQFLVRARFYKVLARRGTISG